MSDYWIISEMVSSHALSGDEWVELTDTRVLDYFTPDGDGLSEVLVNGYPRHPLLRKLKFNERPGYIYCGTVNRNTVKIGGTGNFPSSRFKQHGSYIEPLFWIPVSSWREAEAIIHDKFDEYRLGRREEFTVSPLKVFETMHSAFLPKENCFIETFDPAHIITIRRAYRRHLEIVPSRNAV